MSEEKVDVLEIKKEEIEKEVEKVKEIKNKIDEEAEKLKLGLLQLIKESKEKNLKSIENYETILKKELEILDPNQTASNFNEILEKAEKVENVLLKERKEYQIKSFDNFKKSIKKSIEDNFQIEEESKIDKSRRVHRKIKLEFHPILIFFDIVPSNNFAQDFAKLKDIVTKDEDFFDRVAKYIFNYYDKDKNGKIDKKELKVLLSDVSDLIFPKMKSEFHSLVNKLEGETKKTISKFFTDEMDQIKEVKEIKNSIKEVKGSLKTIEDEFSTELTSTMNEESLEETFDEIDEDGSGSIDFEEFKNYFKMQTKGINQALSEFKFETDGMIDSVLKEIEFFGNEIKNGNLSETDSDKSYSFL
eukprot:gene4829-8415_t